MRFCEASAKDNFNVDEIFLKLVDDILSKVGVFSVNLNNNLVTMRRCYACEEGAQHRHIVCKYASN